MSENPDTSLETVVDDFPVTTTQQRCWFLDQIEPGNTALNIAVRWEIRGKVAAGSLQRAFQLVTDRHEVLRTRFIERDGEPMQQVMARVAFRMAELDLRTTPEADRLERIDAIAREEGQRPFDLSQPCLLRATLVRWEAERAVILITAHQSVFDGHSIGVLGREVGHAADAFEAARTPDLPDLPLQFGDFALWQQEYLSSGVLEDEGAWWQERLVGAPYFELPTDKPRPPQQVPTVKELTLDLPPSFTETLAARAREEEVTPFTFGYGVLTACLHRLTGAEDILLGTQTAGRIDVDLDPLIGVFINNLVLRTTVAPDTTLSEHIAGARQVVEGALAHQTIPFNKLVERLNPQRDAARNPLISMNFNLANVFMQGHRFETFEMVSVPSHHPGAVYDLQIVMVGRPSGYRLSMDYQTALFEAETMERLLAQVAACLTAAIERPDMTLSQLPLDPVLKERFSAESDDVRALTQCLGAHPLVDEVAVMTEGNRRWAFVTPGKTGTQPLETLPGVLMSSIAQAQTARPDGISVLAGFPRTSRGDINRSLLRVPRQTVQNVLPAPLDPALLVRLRDHWRDVLSISDIPEGANFFDLGGHSLLAVRLLSRIRRDWGLNLGIATIYEHATLSALATVIAAQVTHEPEVAEEDWRILRLRVTGDEPALVSVNSAALPLAATGAMTPARAATCVRLYDDSHGIDTSPRRFEDYAADYATLIRQAQPDGPYLLYGNCVHGNLALEAARILQADGAEITGVVMKDVWEPGFSERIAHNRGARWQDRRHALRSRIRRVRAGTLSVSAALGAYSIVRKTGVLQLAAALGLIERVRNSDLEEIQERVIDAMSTARNAYRPASLAFPVLHVVTGITPRGGHFPASIGWEEIVSGPLKTVYIESVLEHPKHRAGVDAFAREIEIFLNETAPG